MTITVHTRAPWHADAPTLCQMFLFCTFFMTIFCVHSLHLFFFFFNAMNGIPSLVRSIHFYAFAHLISEMVIVSAILIPSAYYFDSCWQVLICINSLSVAVRPTPPNVTLTSKSPHELLLRFSIPAGLHHFPPGFRNKIRYRSQFDPVDSWTDFPFHEANKHATNFSLVLDNLLPYTVYMVEVQLQSFKVNRK